MKPRLRPLLLACSAICATLGLADAAAQTLYKLIDKNGKVTYSESRPKEFDGQVVPMNIDPNANTATLPKLQTAPASPTGRSDSDAPRKSMSRDDRVQAAKDKLEAAKKALQDATDNPKEEDYTWLGTVSGGTRRVPTEDFQKRLTELERRIRKAEEELKLAEQS